MADGWEKKLLTQLESDLTKCNKNIEALKKLLTLYTEHNGSLSRSKVDVALATSLKHVNETHTRMIRLMLLLFKELRAKKKNDIGSAADSILDTIMKEKR